MRSPLVKLELLSVSEKPAVSLPMAILFAFVPSQNKSFRLVIEFLRVALFCEEVPRVFHVLSSLFIYKKLEKISSISVIVPSLLTACAFSPVLGFTRDVKPNPWVISCSNTVKKPVKLPPLLSNP